MSEAMLLSDREYGSPEAAILSTRSISLFANPDFSGGTGAVLAIPGARMPSRPRVSCGPANWTISVSNPTAEVPTWLLPSVNALVDVLNLTTGWSSQSAKQVVAQNAMAALELLAGLLNSDAPPPAVVPKPQGRIQLEWHTDETAIEVYIDSPDSVRLFAEGVTGELFAEGPLVGNEEKLRLWLERLTG